MITKFLRLEVDLFDVEGTPKEIRDRIVEEICARGVECTASVELHSGECVPDCATLVEDHDLLTDEEVDVMDRGE